ncbi:Ig-like domain-containing protein [Streptomyces cellostaticus]|uniref:Ig-like domain-containing protein n=1 Tax=Streptomyces cellostaticus TaxID=67285 RepID=UPI002540AB76|nr:Ig-like domain-containing protein [Streptomyces cellostaticus]
MATSTTNLTSAPDPSVAGQPVTFTAVVQPELVDGPVPTGTVEFLVDAVAVATVPLDASGQAQYTTGDLAAGLHAVEADYGGDEANDPSAGSDTQEVSLAQTTTTLTFDPEPSQCGETVTFTAQVTPVPPATGTPTGLVSFIVSDDGPVLTAPVDGDGQAQVTIGDLDVGFHQAAAFYTGDENFDASNSPLTLHVVEEAPVSVVVSADPDPSVCGQSVALCATVSPVSSSVGTPSGSVTFTGPGGLDETVPLDAGGQACVTTSTLQTGTVTATYGGDGCYASGTGTTDVTVEPAMSAVSVVVDPDPSVCGQPVTVCATVTAVAPGSGTPSGSVTFIGPGGLDERVALDADGTACVTTIALESGTVTAVYGGDTCFTGSAESVDMTVGQASSAVAVSVNPDPSVCGETVTVCATVTAVAPGTGTPSGSVTFTGLGGPDETVPLDADGTACVTTATLQTGTVTAVYNGDDCFTTSTGTADVGVSQAASTTTVTVDPNPSVCGQSVTVCATVTAVAPGSGTPSGSVTFTGLGGPDETVPLDADGTACVTTATLQTGTVTAVYNGDDCFTTSTGTTPVTVNQAASTTTVTVDPNPSVCGQPVTVCATVTAVAPGTGTPSGSVTFTAPGGPDETVPLDADGTACVTTATLQTGTVTAVYNGDDCFTTSTGTTPVTVNQAASTTTVTVDPNPSVCGQPVTAIVTVTAAAPSTGTPTGSVTLTAPGVNRTLTLDQDGTAHLPLPSPGGVTGATVTAVYNGDGCFTTSTGTTSMTVNQADSTTTVTVDPTPSVCGQPVTVCATVTAVAPGSGRPTGTVTFTAPGGLNTTVRLDVNRTACVTTSSLTSGTIKAVYNGDGCFTTSTGTTPVTVSQAASTTTVTVDPTPSVCGQPVTVCATVTAVAPGTGTPSGSVTFTAPGGLNTTVPLNADGTACVTNTTLGTGTVTAVYNGDDCFTTSTGTTPVTVDQAASTTTVTVNPNPSVCGQPVTVCATVTAVAPGTGTPSGSVTFTAPGGLNTTVPLNASGTACATTSSLTGGTVTAVYNGDGCFTTSTGTTGVVVNNAPTMTVLTVSPNPVVCGRPVTYCATVTAVAPGTGTPTGTVTFTGPGGFVQTVALSAGSACVTTTAGGSGTVTAVYNGNSCNSPSAATANVTVNPAPTTLTAASAQIRVRANGTFVIPSMSATLKVTSSAAPLAGQLVTFRANTPLAPTVLGTALTDASGVATLAPPALPVSSTLITATSYTASFAGTSCYAPSSATAPLTFVSFPVLP